jgi:hypothetical protein
MAKDSPAEQMQPRDCPRIAPALWWTFPLLPPKLLFAPTIAAAIRGRKFMEPPEGRRCACRPDGPFFESRHTADDILLATKSVANRGG